MSYLLSFFIGTHVNNNKKSTISQVLHNLDSKSYSREYFIESSKFNHFHIRPYTLLLSDAYLWILFESITWANILQKWQNDPKKSLVDFIFSYDININNKVKYMFPRKVHLSFCAMKDETKNHKLTWPLLSSFLMQHSITNNMRYNT